MFDAFREFYVPRMGSYSFSMKDINVTSYDGGGVAVPSGYEGNEQFFLTQATSQVEVEVYDGTGCPKFTREKFEPLGQILPKKGMMISDNIHIWG